MPFLRCSQYDCWIAATFRAAGQSLSQRSTDSAQARYGSKSTGQAVGVQSVRRATVIADSLAVAPSALRIHPVDDGGRRELFICPAIVHGVAGIACRLGVIDLKVDGRCINHHALHTLDMQSGGDGGAHNIAAEFLIVISKECLK